MKRAGRVLLGAVLGVVVTTIAACGGQGQESGGGQGGARLTLVAYSTPQEAYKEKLIPAFQKTPEGRGVQFDQSYGASGGQSRAVESGLPADVLALSLEPDITRLEDPGLIEPGWNEDEHDGFVTRSVVVLATRPGNPKNIRTWEDLTRPGVEVITPNPFTSGGAKWNVMAAYGSQLEQGESDQEATQFLERLFKNVPVQDKSARESLQTFTGGKGDVLLAYENEAITAKAKGEQLDYVIPDETIQIENPVAVAKESANPEKARQFVDFLRSEPGQRIFAESGYRPVVESVEDPKRFPEPKSLFEIADVGGWSEVNDRFFEPETGVFAEINRKKGVPTD